MTFRDWKNTPDGKESFKKSFEHTENSPAGLLHIEDLMWSDYQASDDWQYYQHPNPKAENAKEKECK